MSNQRNWAFLVGVEDYTHPNYTEVQSGRHNLVAWLVHAARLRMLEGRRTFYCSNPRLSRTYFRSALAQLDLSTRERAELNRLFEDWFALGGGYNKADYHTITLNLVFMAAGMHHEASLGGPPPRALFVLSGHGALIDDGFHFCPSNVRPTRYYRSTLIGRAERVIAGRFARLRALADQGPGAPGVAAIDRLATQWRDLGNAAKSRGVGLEMAELMRAMIISLSDGVSHSYQWGMFGMVVGQLDRWALNLGHHFPTPVTRARRAEIAGTLNEVHLMLALGELTKYATVVLDACHSGGPGTTLQGTSDLHGWIQRGFDGRIFSAAQQAQLAAEAKLGHQWFGAATWALTRVLGRWRTAKEREFARVISIRNGDLALRANMILTALSFNQHVGYSGPRRSEDLAFLGYDAATPTFVNPNASTGGIEISPEHDGITDTFGVWLFTKTNATSASQFIAAIVASGTTAATQLVGGADLDPDMARFYVRDDKLSELVGQDFKVWAWTGNWNAGDPAPSAVATVNSGISSGTWYAHQEQAYDEGTEIGAGPVTGFANPSGGPFWKWGGTSGSNASLRFLAPKMPFTPPAFGGSQSGIWKVEQWDFSSGSPAGVQTDWRTVNVTGFRPA